MEKEINELIEQLPADKQIEYREKLEEKKKILHLKEYDPTLKRNLDKKELIDLVELSEGLIKEVKKTKVKFPEKFDVNVTNQQDFPDSFKVTNLQEFPKTIKVSNQRKFPKTIKVSNQRKRIDTDVKSMDEPSWFRDGIKSISDRVVAVEKRLDRTLKARITNPSAIKSNVRVAGGNVGVIPFDDFDGQTRKARVDGVGTVQVNPISGVTIASPIDANSGALTSIDHAHHEIHEGDMFTFCFHDSDLDGSEALDFVFKSPTTVRQAHVFIEARGTLETNVQMFRGVSVHNIGTTVQAYNRNLTKPDDYDSLLFQGSSIASVGTTICTFHFGLGKKSGGEDRSNSEWVVNGGSLYMLRITSEADNNNVSGRIIWYEHEPSA